MGEKKIPTDFILLKCKNLKICLKLLNIHSIFLHSFVNVNTKLTQNYFMQ